MALLRYKLSCFSCTNRVILMLTKTWATSYTCEDQKGLQQSKITSSLASFSKAGAWTWTESNLEGFAWSHQSITGLIYNNNNSFWQVGLLDAVRSEYSYKFHKFNLSWCHTLCFYWDPFTTCRTFYTSLFASWRRVKECSLWTGK